MDWIGVHCYERTKKREDEPALRYAGRIGGSLTSSEIAEETRIFGMVADRDTAEIVLRSFSHFGELTLEAVTRLLPIHLAGIPESVLEEVLACRPDREDLVFIARLRIDDRAPLLIGAVVRRGRFFALFDGLDLLLRLSPD